MSRQFNDLINSMQLVKRESHRLSNKVLEIDSKSSIVDVPSSRVGSV